MIEYKTLMQLPALKPVEVLRMLYKIALHESTREKPDLPHIKVITTTGNVVDGILLSMNESENTLALGGIHKDQTSLHYLQLSAVAGVEISPSETWLHTLSRGKLPFVPDPEEVPGNLQLNALVKEKEKQCQEMFKGFKSFDLELGAKDDLVMRYLGHQLMNKAGDVLHQISQDQLAKEAFESEVQKMMLVIADEEMVGLKNGLLLIGVDASKGPEGIFKMGTLKKKIEALL